MDPSSRRSHSRKSSTAKAAASLPPLESHTISSKPRDSEDDRLSISEPEPDTPPLLPKVHLDLAEVRTLRWLFGEHACADGLLYRRNDGGFPQLIHTLLGESLGPPEGAFLYRWFDTGHDDRLSMKEFIMGCMMLAHGDRKDGVIYLFRVYAHDSVVPKKNLEHFAAVSKELEKYYNMEETGNCDCEMETIGYEKFAKILARNAAVLRCMQELKRKISHGIKKVEREKARDVIEAELANMGFEDTKYWEEGYDVFAATTSNSTDSETSRDLQSPSVSKDSLSGMTTNFPIKMGGTTHSLDQKFSIHFLNLEFEKRIGWGSFAEVWKGKWLDSPVAIKVFIQSLKDRPCKMRMCEATEDTIRGPVATSDSSVNTSASYANDPASDSSNMRTQRSMNLPTGVDDSSGDFGESLMCPDESMLSKMSAAERSVCIKQALQSRMVETTKMDSRAQEAHIFSYETQLLTSLRHPNVLLYLGACSNPKYPFCIVSELVDGGSLFNYLHTCLRGPPETKQAFRLAQDIARGMYYLHCQSPPVLHRDLKSANILIENFVPNCDPSEANANLKAVIIDFGLSRTEGPGAYKCEVGAGENRRLVGSLLTMAPEVMSGDGYTWAADVYSYGVVLWELFTGRIPNAGLDPATLIYRVTDKRLRPNILPEDQIPEGIREIIRECWAERPKDRPIFKRIVERLNEIKKGMQARGEW